MTLYRALAQLGRLLMEFAEREIERREQAPEPLIEQVRASWEAPRTLDLSPEAILKALGEGYRD